MDELVKKGLIRNFVLDKNTGAIAFIDRAGLLTRSATKFAPEIELQIQAILFEAPQISAEALIATGALAGFVEGKIPPFKDTGKIPSLEIGKIATLGELGRIPELEKEEDLEKLKEQAKEQQKNFNKLFVGILTVPKLTAEEKARQKELARLGVPQLEIPKLAQPIIEIPKLAQPTIEIPKLAQPTIQIPKLKFPEITFSIPRFPKAPTKPKIPKFILFDFDKELRLMKLPKFDEGVDLFIKEKGKRRKRESNINIDTALDIGAFIVDNSVSREFSFKETGKKPVKSKIRVPKDYWERTQSKFRNFQIKQGQLIPLKNRFIEKVDFAIDSRGEVQQLSAARLLAQQRKPKKQKFKQFDITKIIKF